MTPAATRFELPARLLFWAALAFAVVMACLPHPPQVPTDRLGDKVNHILAFATLAALAAIGWPRAPRWRTVERLSFLGAVIEVVQSIPALQRDCDIRDWIADTAAILVVTGLAALFARRGGGARPQ
ncbi:hypothetical protein ACFOON_04865 [Novosphingobium piscinae]|uniref:VanZ-like domain-containing protein n=1 Tax=Novosphingobium piscinae TaxID=1507448 RepID=A0A7X1FXR7_9SPHN|nr:hypothetical protein [Novosphingobium piscinae]MBC2668302.1 hypothetical protein [Novosphingobium piscinae]